MTARNAGSPTWTHFDPLDLWCPVKVCHASPGVRCVWTDGSGVTRSRRPHAERVSDARAATDRAERRATGRRPGWSSPPPPAS